MDKQKHEVVRMFGARLASLRREADMSQADLAKALKVSPSAIGMYEQGRREPSLELIAAMARVLNVSVDYLVTGAAPEDEQALEHMLLNRIRSADRRLEGRTDRPFSRQELAVLFAALLMES